MWDRMEWRGNFLSVLRGKFSDASRAKKNMSRFKQEKTDKVIYYDGEKIS